MNEDIGQLLDRILDEVTALNGPKLLLVFLIAVGYGLKTIKQIDNEHIPKILAVAGAMFAPFLVGWPATGDMDASLRYAEIAAWCQVLMQGFLLGVAARLIHQCILKKWFDDRFGNGIMKPTTETKTP